MLLLAYRLSSADRMPPPLRSLSLQRLPQPDTCTGNVRRVTHDEIADAVG
jgi:hypothetical protein